MRAIFVSAIAILLTAPLLAHHGSSGYDRTHPLTLSGTIREVELINPHSFIYLDVAGGKGEKGATWALEVMPPQVLARSGWTTKTLKPGMKITVIGYPPAGAAPMGNGTFRTLDDALAYSPDALNYLRTNRILQAGEIRFKTGEVGRFGMGPSFDFRR